MLTRISFRFGVTQPPQKRNSLFEDHHAHWKEATMQARWQQNQYVFTRELLEPFLINDTEVVTRRGVLAMIENEGPQRPLTAAGLEAKIGGPMVYRTLGFLESNGMIDITGGVSVETRNLVITPFGSYVLKQLPLPPTLVKWAPTL